MSEQARRETWRDWVGDVGDPLPLTQLDVCAQLAASGRAVTPRQLRDWEGRLGILPPAPRDYRRGKNKFYPDWWPVVVAAVHDAQHANPRFSLRQQRFAARSAARNARVMLTESPGIALAPAPPHTPETPLPQTLEDRLFAFRDEIGGATLVIKVYDDVGKTIHYTELS